MQFATPQIRRIQCALIACLCALACALFVVPGGQAFADTGECVNCGRVTTGTYSYDNYYGTVCYAPTCTQDGLGCFVCSECGTTNRPVTVPALGHDYQYDGCTSTCTDAGENVYVCSRCGDSYTESAAALGHSYVQTDATEATCTAAGSATYACSRCGDVYTEATPALGHSYVKSGGSEATCTEGGAVVYTCERCDHSYTEHSVALGHDYVITTEEPTCTKKGATIHTCSRCGDTYSEPIDALGHAMEEKEVVQPTCVDEGTRTLVCTRCGVEEKETLEPLGHLWPETWIVEKKPTLFDKGLEYRLCERCGEREERTIPTLSIMETPVGPGILIGVIVLAGGGIALFLKRRAAQGLATAAATAATAAAASGLEGISLIERTIFAKVSDDPSNEEFLEIIRERPNLSVTLFDPEKGTTLAEQVSEVGPNAVLLDFTGAAGLAEAQEVIEGLRADNESVSFELIAFDADEALILQLEDMEEAEKLFAYAKGDQNKYVKMARLVVPLYKDFMKENSSLETIGKIADLFGIPAVSTMLGAVVTARDIKDVAQTAKDAVDGVDMEVADGAAVVSTIASLLGCDATAAVAGLVVSVSDAVDTVESDEEGSTHTAYKAGTITKDVGDAIGTLLK